MFLDFAIHHLPSTPVILEAGAHDGSDTLLMANLWPQGQIFAFEPSPYWQPVLKEKFAPFPNISFFPMALGDRVGSTSFYQCTSNTGGCDSTFRPLADDVFWTTVAPAQFAEEPINVPVTTLDAWAEEQQINHIDFMWLDMQGAEGQVLKASPEILKKTKFIQAEYSELPVYEGIMLFGPLKALLKQRDFIVVSLWKANSDDIQGNALFMNTSLCT
jgi:FkbM family methyltransferase